MPFGASLSHARRDRRAWAPRGTGERHIGFPSDAAPAGTGRPSSSCGAAAAVAALAALTGCDLQENADPERGEQLFTQKCGSCHALTAAGTNADVGPDLDLAFEAAREAGMDQDTIEGVVESQIENPRPASPEDVEVYMPANLVEGDDAEDVAAYVASVAGVAGIKPPVFIAPEFFATNCGGCHTLGAAGTTGTIGPNLDDVLPGQSPTRSRESITDPRRRRPASRRRDARQLRRDPDPRAAPAAGPATCSTPPAAVASNARPRPAEPSHQDAQDGLIRRAAATARAASLLGPTSWWGLSPRDARSAAGPRLSTRRWRAAPPRSRPRPARRSGQRRRRRGRRPRRT